MVSKFRDTWDWYLGQMKAVERRIDFILSDKWPINSMPYQASPCAREFEEYDINKMLAMDAIELVQAEWVTPILFWPIKTVYSDFYALSQPQSGTHSGFISHSSNRQIYVSLYDDTIFFMLDANTSYWQVEVANEDGDKTAFIPSHAISI